MSILHVRTEQQAENAFSRALHDERAWVVELGEFGIRLLEQHGLLSTSANDEPAGEEPDEPVADDADERDEDDLTCTHCGRECGSKIGLHSHERACARKREAAKAEATSHTKQAARKRMQGAKPKAASTGKTKAKTKAKSSAKPKRARKAKIQCGCGKVMGENGFNGWHANWCPQAGDAQPVA